MVIKAVGQRPDIGFNESGRTSRSIGPEESWQTNGHWPPMSKAVFAGGDAMTGPATVIEAIAAGQRAASSIRDYLHGKVAFQLSSTATDIS